MAFDITAKELNELSIERDMNELLIIIGMHHIPKPVNTTALMRKFLQLQRGAGDIIKTND